MKKVLKYLVAAVLFSFSISSHAKQVSDELAHKILTEGEPIASGDTGYDDDKIWLSSALRYRGEIYFCEIIFVKSYLTGRNVEAWCFDKHTK